MSAFATYINHVLRGARPPPPPLPPRRVPPAPEWLYKPHRHRYSPGASLERANAPRPSHRAGDPHAAHLLPIDPDTDALFTALADGIVRGPPAPSHVVGFMGT